MKKLISIVIPCFNEERNIVNLYHRIINQISELKNYDFNIIFIDNASTDNSVEILKSIAQEDTRLKIIVNLRNFGAVRSPCWAMLQAKGDAVILLHADMQVPPELINVFILHWERSWKVVFATKLKSNINGISARLRKFYYRFLNLISEVPLVNDATGVGLYDREVLEYIRKAGGPLPYLRGLVSEFGYPIKRVEYIEAKRGGGKSNVNFLAALGEGVIGIISHSIVPIRFVSLIGIVIASMSFIASFTYLVLKLIYWERYSVGIAPLIVGTLFLFGVLFICIGIIGEYVASIHRYIRGLPMVIEKERINF